MAQTYLLFDLGSDEEKVQQARHKLEKLESKPSASQKASVQAGTRTIRLLQHHGSEAGARKTENPSPRKRTQSPSRNPLNRRLKTAVP